jgi:hypothetical protein
MNDSDSVAAHLTPRAQRGEHDVARTTAGGSPGCELPPMERIRALPGLPTGVWPGCPFCPATQISGTWPAPVTTSKQRTINCRRGEPLGFIDEVEGGLRGAHEGALGPTVSTRGRQAARG